MPEYTQNIRSFGTLLSTGEMYKPGEIGLWDLFGVGLMTLSMQSTS